MKYLKNTPNLIVNDVLRSLKFYEGVLGFTRQILVPEAAPFVFASVVSGEVEIFLNEKANAVKDYPAFGKMALGGTLSMFIEVEGIDEIFRRIEQNKVKVVMPMDTKFYGMREFAVADPDGYLITFAQRVG